MSDDQKTGDSRSPCGCSNDQVERIHAYLDGALTVEDLQQIADHIDACPDCTREHDLEQVIRTVVRRSCTETAPETLRASIMNRIQEACGAPHERTAASGTAGGS